MRKTSKTVTIVPFVTSLSASRVTGYSERGFEPGPGGRDRPAYPEDPGSGQGGGRRKDRRPHRHEGSGGARQADRRQRRHRRFHRAGAHQERPQGGLRLRRLQGDLLRHDRVRYR